MRISWAFCSENRCTRLVCDRAEFSMHVVILCYHIPWWLHAMWTITVTSQWVRWCPKSPASRLLAQPFSSGADQRKHQSSAWLAFVRGPLDCSHNRPFAGGIHRIPSLHCRHNDHDGVSNHQPHGCLLKRLFRRTSKKTSKFRVTGLCVGNSPGPVNSPHKGPFTRKIFPFDEVIMSQMTRDAKIWCVLCC